AHAPEADDPTEIDDWHAHRRLSVDAHLQSLAILADIGALGADEQSIQVMLHGAPPAPPAASWRAMYRVAERPGATPSGRQSSRREHLRHLGAGATRGVTPVSSSRRRRATASSVRCRSGWSKPTS